jgi:hypothetical protein
MILEIIYQLRVNIIKKKKTSIKSPPSCTAFEISVLLSYQRPKTVVKNSPKNFRLLWVGIRIQKTKVSNFAVCRACLLQSVVHYGKLMLYKRASVCHARRMIDENY